MSKPQRPSRRRSSGFSSALINLMVGILAGLMTIGLILFGCYIYLQSQLPTLDALNDIHYQAPMRIYSRDGLLIGEFGEKIRYPVELKDVPKPLVQAFLAAEDNRFYDHPGFDYQGLLRATVTYVMTGEKRQGGSTITMQVARNFFLSNEKTFLRKIREILLAIKIEAELPKERILELYLNKIYLGNHAYGVTAAAKVYYNKTLNELSLAETAMIAGLPKAPSTFNPIINPDRSMTRRNYVLGRMKEGSFITDEAYHQAMQQPNTALLHAHNMDLDLPYIAEIVRNQMFEQYGEEAYSSGYQVKTTIDSRLQLLAEKTLRSNLHHFDEKRRFHAIKEHIDLKKYTDEAAWDRQLAVPGKLGDTIPALITSLKGSSAEVYLGQGKRMTLSSQDLAWAHQWLNNQRIKGENRKALVPGDVLRLRDSNGHLKLTQIPEVGGALVSVLPKDGQVIAIAGGYDFHYNKFNRAIQSKRQPGSGFKPVIYSTALMEGMTPSSIVVDAPVSFGKWSPMNASRRFYGPTPLRTALTYSRNVVAVKLLQKVGVTKAIKLALSFGFEPDELPKVLPLALGAGSASPLRMAQMYSVFANGGFRINPYFIDRVDTDSGKTIYQATPPTACVECDPGSEPTEGTARRVLTPEVHFMMNSMLKDVVRFGTARKALALKRPDIAGKTGTTNKSYDAWFNGYTPELVTIAWFGYDVYKSLGHNQMGGDLALPMWIEFMEEALKDKPVTLFAAPEPSKDYRRVKIGSKSATPDYEYISLKKQDKREGSRSSQNKSSVSLGKEDPNGESRPRPKPQVKPGKEVESLF